MPNSIPVGGRKTPKKSSPPNAESKLEYLEKGLAPIPLAERSKQPPRGFPLEVFLKRRMTLGEAAHWFPNNSENIGLVTGVISNTVVVDIENVEDGRRFWKMQPTEGVVKTGRGVHLSYWTSEEIPSGVKKTVLGITADIRAETGYVVAPPSVHPTGKQYQWVFEDWKHLPTFNQNWIEQEPLHISIPMQEITKTIKDGRKYIQKILAISGQGGHNQAYRCACKLADSGMTPQEAFEAMLEWNCTNAVPPFSEKELADKITDAFARGNKNA